MDNNNALKRPSLHLNDFILQYITMTSNVFKIIVPFMGGEGGTGERGMERNLNKNGNSKNSARAGNAASILSADKDSLV